MSRGKTGLLILTAFAAMFILFVAILFNTTTKREAAIDRKAELDDRLDLIAESDLTIYWLGEPYKELDHLSSAVSVIPYADASRNTLPVKGPSLHTSEYNEEGMLIQENIPIDYPRYMVIVITGTPEFTEEGREALLDAISKNGVPVIAIGDEAAEALAEILSYRRFHKGPGSSLYYCLGHGYKENFLPEETVLAGGMELAELIPDQISLAMTDYEPKN